MLITDGTSFSSAHAYKAEGVRSCLRCGTAKKPKATRDQVPWPRAKNHPTENNSIYFCKIYGLNSDLFVKKKKKKNYKVIALFY